MIKNIAILVHGLWSGGAERIAGLLSKELAKTYNVYLFLVNTDHIVYDYGGTLVNVAANHDYENNITMYKRKYHIDCAISFLEDMNYKNIRTKRTEKVIISERCVQLTETYWYMWSRFLRKGYYHYADAIVACAEGVKFDVMRSSHQIPEYAVKTIYNFIDKEGIVLKSQENLPKEAQDFLGGNPFFLNVGRLNPQKNQRRLILQFAHLHAANPHVKLLILGDKDSDIDLMSHIEKLGLEDFIKILPFTKNPFAYMARAKALVLSSLYVGVFFVLLEDMTLGCPIIATDCLSGPRELLMDECNYEKKLDKLEICKRGILVCNEETEDEGISWYMAKAMEMICLSETMTENFRQNSLKYMEEYTNQRILQQWIEVINEEVKGEVVSTRTAEEQKLQSAKHIVIYGAGKVGREVFRQLSSRHTISCFAVSERKDEDEICLGIPIREIAALQYLPADTVVVIGVGKKYLYEVLDKLWECGFEQIVMPYL